MIVSLMSVELCIQFELSDDAGIITVVGGHRYF
jgi:hypothetical protein